MKISRQKSHKRTNAHIQKNDKSNINLPEDEFNFTNQVIGMINTHMDQVQPQV